EDIPEKVFDLLLGGSGLGAKILLEETPAKVDPLSPENKLIFAVGAFQGVNFPGNGKWSVITKGPLTGTFLESAGTGHWAPYFKKCGYDAVVFEGKASSPVYVVIRDDSVEFRDAAFLWGKDTVETGVLIKEDLGDKRINALNIGPSGEILNPIACVTCDGHSFAGRGGAGAVMGSKNLKAVAAWGTKEVPVYDREKASEYAKEIFKLLHEQGEGFRNHGTPTVMVPLEEIGDVPIKYWRGDENKHGAYLLGAPRYTEYLNVKPLPCINCPVGCHRHIHFEYPDGTVLGALAIASSDFHCFTPIEQESLEAIGREVGGVIHKAALAEELAAAKAEAEFYLDVMIHDINNANNVAMGYLDLLREEISGEQRTFADRCMQGIRQSSGIIEEVRTLRTCRG
ncbi:MAG: hypothetical protein EOM65_16315, partial [Synergistales bacterium]|nr:hypothetical protein [Synergistales bacterium]